MSAIDQPMVTETPPTPPVAAPGAPTRWAIWFFPLMLGLLVADQATKYWIFALPRDADLPHWLDRTVNPGVAWGVFGDSPQAVVAMTLALIPLLVWVWWRHFRLAGTIENAAFALILGGALGNAWDRVSASWRPAWDGHRGVRDFIYVDLNVVGIDYVWPNFNVADAGICVGFFLLVLLSWRHPRAARG